MNTINVWLFAKVSALNAELEGMKAANQEMTAKGYGLQYTESDFMKIADKIDKAILIAEQKQKEYYKKG